VKIRFRNIILRLSLLAALLPGSTYLAAQEDKIDAILDSMFFSNDEELMLMLAEMNRTHHFLYLRTGYDSKTTYAGREIGSDQFNMSGQLFYINSLGFNLGVSGAWYSQMDPSYRSTVLTAGYSNGLKNNKWLRYRLSYNRYFYNIGDSDYEPVYTGSAGAGISLKAGPVGARLDYSLLMGSEYGSQLSADLYGNFTLLKSGNKFKVRILPEVSFYFGSETVESDRYSYLDRNMQSSGSAEPVYVDRFGLMNTQVRLPIEFTIGDLDIEIGYIYNFNRSIDPAYTFDNISMVSLSVGYFFMLN